MHRQQTEFVMQLLEASSARRDEFVDNNRGDMRRPRYHVEKEELQRLSDIYNFWTNVASALGLSEESVLNGPTLL